MDVLLYHKAEGFVNKVRRRFGSCLVMRVRLWRGDTPWKAMGFLKSGWNR